jgi:RND superfamily putative drug exporter
MHHRNLAARAGRWSAQHRRKAILGWLAFVFAAVAIGGAVGTDKLASHELGAGESGRADRVLHDAGLTDAVTENVLVTAREGGTVRTGAGRAALADVLARTKGVEQVADVRSPVISRDGRSALVQLQLATDFDHAPEAVDPLTDAVAAIRADHPGVTVEQTGDGSIAKAFEDTLAEDFKKAELFSIPLTFLVLFLAFGAVVAAGVPLLLGLTAVAAALGLVALPSQLVPLEESAASVILLIGLAVGVDYALFYLRREREERAAGRSAEAALNAAAATSGRAVLISGFTVMASVAGMFAADSKWYTSYAIGIIVVVGIAMVGSVTVLPAVLSKLGDRVERGRLPFVGRRSASGRSDGRFWEAVLRVVLGRPIASAVLAAAVLIALSLPVLNLKLGDPGMGSLPQDTPAVQAFEHAQAAFPGGSRPAVVVIQAPDVTDQAVKDALLDLTDAAVATDGVVGRPLGSDVSADKTVARVTVPLAGDGVDDTSEAALATLRRDVIPWSLGPVEGVETAVTGPTAASVDLQASTEARAPIVFLLVLGMGFLLLLMTFRSIVIPLKAIVLNLLSVGAAYGVLVLVFQEGWFSGLLGFEPTGTIATWLPVMLFVILFGLSMDYHVFVLSRVREAFDRGLPMDQAVAEGVKGTAATVTSAAAVMVAVFGVFATLGILEMKQLGVGLAVAVLIDATIVRAVLLPATMKLLGRWNWYLPKALDWLPRLGEVPVGGRDGFPVASRP